VASLRALATEITECRQCERLIRCCTAARDAPPRRFAGETYWARPVPGFGDAAARLLVVGLAPAAHGGNRTGRVFTGDRSGDFLFESLYRSGLANQATCTDSADGLVLNDVRVAAAVRCAPPGNAPTPAERADCAPWLDAEWRLTGIDVRVIVALGGFAWQAALTMIRRAGGSVGTPAPKFGMNRYMVLAETEEKALEVGRRAYRRWWQSFMALWLKHNTAPTNVNYPPEIDGQIADGRAIATTPAKALELLRGQIAESGANYLVGRFAFGDLSLSESMRSLELFQRHVMPALRESVPVAAE